MSQQATFTQQKKTTRSQQSRPQTAPAANGEYQNGGDNGAWQQPSRSSNGYTSKPKPQQPRKGGNAAGKQPQQPRQPSAPKDLSNVRTIYINKVFMRDLEQSGVGPQLKQQRINLLRDVLSQFGELESFEDQVESGNSVLVTYRDHETAVKALESLKNKEETEGLMETAIAKLKKMSLPESVCPPLFKYRYGLATNNKKGPKTAYAQNKTVQAVKTVVAGQSPQTPQSPQEQPKQQAAKKEKKGKQTPAPAPAAKHEEESVKVEYLTRKTEIARLQEEKAFFARQLTHVRSELEAERVRVGDRLLRITSLSQDLERVQLEKQRLETQLENENKWKKKGEESIAKLEDELRHLQTQQTEAEQRLQQFSKTQH